MRIPPAAASMVSGEGRTESGCCGRRQRGGAAAAARGGSGRVGSGRVGWTRGDQLVGHLHPHSSAARLGTDRIGAVPAGARSWMFFGGRALALPGCHCGSGGEGGGGVRAPPTALNGNQCLPSNILMARVRVSACVCALKREREREI